MRTILATAFVFLFSSSAAFAAPLDSSQAEMWHGPAVVPVSSVEGGGSAEVRRPAPMPANVPNIQRPGMSGMRDEFMMHGSSTSMRPGMMQMHGGPLGTVTAVSANSFTLQLPGNKERATSTVTVNITNATVYQHASSTASFSDVIVGSHVVVLGKMATSTNTIAAERVIIVEAMPQKPEVKKGIGGLLDRIKNFFGVKPHAAAEVHGDARVRTEGGPAAAIQSGFMNGLFTAVFGWL